MVEMKTKQSWWGNFWRDKDGNVAIIQMPNIPIIVWFILLVAAQLLGKGMLQSGFKFLSGAALVTWAYLEITEGASYFRRTLGAIVMLAVILSHLWFK